MLNKETFKIFCSFCLLRPQSHWQEYHMQWNSPGFSFLNSPRNTQTLPIEPLSLPCTHFNGTIKWGLISLLTFTMLYWCSPFSTTIHYPHPQWTALSSVALLIWAPGSSTCNVVWESSASHQICTFFCSPLFKNFLLRKELWDWF